MSLAAAEQPLPLFWRCDHMRVCVLPKQLGSESAFFLVWIAIIPETSELISPGELSLKYTWEIHCSLRCWAFLFFPHPLQQSKRNTWTGQSFLFTIWPAPGLHLQIYWKAYVLDCSFYLIPSRDVHAAAVFVLTTRRAVCLQRLCAGSGPLPVLAKSQGWRCLDSAGSASDWVLG